MYLQKKHLEHPINHSNALATTWNGLASDSDAFTSLVSEALQLASGLFSGSEMLAVNFLCYLIFSVFHDILF